MTDSTFPPAPVRRMSKATAAGQAPQCFCYTVQRNDGKPAGYERGGWA